MSECKLTNPYETEDHHTHVLSDPHNSICSTGAAEKHTSSDLISLHNAKPTCYLSSHSKVWLPYTGLCQSTWECSLSHSREAAELGLLQRGWLAVILKLDNVLLLNLCITYTIYLFTIISTKSHVKLCIKASSFYHRNNIHKIKIFSYF